MKKLRYDLGVFYRSLRRNRPAGRFKEAHPKNLLKRLKGFYSRGGIFAIIGPVLLTTVLCYALYQLILTPGRGFRGIMPPVSTAEPDSGSNLQSPLDFVLDRFKSDDQKKADAEGARQAAQRRLQATLTRISGTVEGKLLEVDQARMRFARRAQEVIGAPIDANPVPNDLAWVVVQQRPAADAWDEIRRDRISDDEFADVSTRLREIVARIGTGECHDDDIERLTELDGLLSEFASRAEGENSALTHLSVILSLRHFQAYTTQKGT